MLKIYNTLTKEKEEFKPQKGKEVKMYTCGPTVYDLAHIGNLRSYLTADFLRRYLEFLGFKVKQIKNITDVGHLTQDADIEGEDKIEMAAKKEKKDPYKIARFYEEKFIEDEKKLNILAPFKYPRATEHIGEMKKIVEKLLKIGAVYEKNGNVFFDIAKFKDYGKLSGNTLEKLKEGARIEPHQDKKNPLDFALWICNPEHLMNWPSQWCPKGYPGWHIECSAMAMKYLGETLDIHTGGEDNIFPHHEDEIAQSEMATGKKFVNTWVHTSWLLVDGEKMSKSKGNFWTLDDLIKKDYNPIAFRLLVLQSHYKKHLNFTHGAMDAAQQGLNKIYDFMETLLLKGEFEKGGASPREIEKIIREHDRRLREAMDNDLNTPQACAAIFEFIREINSLAPLRKKEAQPIYEAMLSWDKVLGLGLEKIGKTRDEIPEEIHELARERQVAREKREFKLADDLRIKIEEAGYFVRDIKEGGYKIEKRK